MRVRIKTFMADKDLNVPTATDLWLGANWMEREAFDFYGFRFTGHPDLRRILNMDEMNYHPLRKEYALEDAGRDDKEDKYFGREDHERNFRKHRTNLRDCVAGYRSEGLLHSQSWSNTPCYARYLSKHPHHGWRDYREGRTYYRLHTPCFRKAR